MTKSRIRAANDSLTNVRIGKRDGEYRVTFKNGTREAREASAYYTTDLVDAIDTARAMDAPVKVPKNLGFDHSDSFHSIVRRARAQRQRDYRASFKDQFRYLKVDDMFTFCHGTDRGVCRKIAARSYIFINEPTKVFTVSVSTAVREYVSKVSRSAAETF